MKAARVPCGPILRMADISADAQYAARGMIQTAPRLPPGGGGGAAHGHGAAGSGGEEAVGGGRAGGRGAGSATGYVVPAMLPVLSETPGSTRWAGPELGQHTDAVLAAELGMGGAELAELRAKGAI
eukprot:362289-Chlamydomonas_euryale.AAC.11